VTFFKPVPKTDGERLPVVLEVLPYHKDDYFYARDFAIYSYLAERGVAEQRLRYADLPLKLIDVLNATLALAPTDDGQRLAQRQTADALQNALDARRQRILLSQSTVSRVKWIGLLVPGVCALIAIAMVHSANRTCAIALVLFATGIAFSILLIGCYSTPFAGEVSISPEQIFETES